jgi:hypothetical protein
MDNQISLADAIYSLVPGANWHMTNDDYDKINWMSDISLKPEKSAVLEELEKLKDKYAEEEYKRLRSAEYPDFKEYLDGFVKSDQEQIDRYISDCLLVKQKYPKPGDS